MYLGRLVLISTLVVAAVAATPAAQEPARSTPLRVYRADTPGLQMPVATHDATPRYTPELIKARVEGTIVVEVTVGIDGRVLDAMVKEGADRLDEQVIAALAEWRFQPGTLNGQPVAVRTDIAFTFRVR